MRAIFILLLTLPVFAQPTATRIGDAPIIRPEMMPKDDGQWSGNIDFPCLIRVPAWIEKPLGKYYLYFSAHRGTYIRLAYADAVTGPWRVYEPGTLRMEQVETVNHSGKAAGRHVASPDIFIDDEHKQLRLYFHFLLPKLGHKEAVALSADGLKFEPQPGAIGAPYMQVFRQADAYFAVEDGGIISRSPDGLEPFKPVTKALATGTTGDPDSAHFRHAGLWQNGDELSIFYTRVGDAPEKIFLTNLHLTSDPTSWKPSPPILILKPERDYEGVKSPVAPSVAGNETNVHHLRDPFVFVDGDKVYLLYAVAGESGIAIAELKERH